MNRSETDLIAARGCCSPAPATAETSSAAPACDGPDCGPDCGCDPCDCADGDDEQR